MYLPVCLLSLSAAIYVFLSLRLLLHLHTCPPSKLLSNDWLTRITSSHPSSSGSFSSSSSSYKSYNSLLHSLLFSPSYTSVTLSPCMHSSHSLASLMLSRLPSPSPFSHPLLVTLHAPKPGRRRHKPACGRSKVFCLAWDTLYAVVEFLASWWR